MVGRQQLVYAIEVLEEELIDIPLMLRLVDAVGAAKVEEHAAPREQKLQREEARRQVGPPVGPLVAHRVEVHHQLDVGARVRVVEEGADEGGRQLEQEEVEGLAQGHRLLRRLVAPLCQRGLLHADGHERRLQLLCNRILVLRCCRCSRCRGRRLGGREAEAKRGQEAVGVALGDARGAYSRLEVVHPLPVLHNDERRFAAGAFDKDDEDEVDDGDEGVRVDSDVREDGDVGHESEQGSVQGDWSRGEGYQRAPRKSKIIKLATTLRRRLVSNVSARRAQHSRRE